MEHLKIGDINNSRLVFCFRETCVPSSRGLVKQYNQELFISPILKLVIVVLSFRTPIKRMQKIQMNPSHILSTFYFEACLWWWWQNLMQSFCWKNQRNQDISSFCFCSGNCIYFIIFDNSFLFSIRKARVNSSLCSCNFYFMSLEIERTVELLL